MANWLLKTEPDVFSIDDLAHTGKKGEPWNGIRNYQARNFLREMTPGDRVLIYHSSCAEPGIVGEGEVISDPVPDSDALNPESPYFDPKSSADNNRWSVVQIRHVKHWPAVISLKTIKTVPELESMSLLRQARLSVSPVTDAEWRCLEQL
ncbi:EVE domain-containing protein [Saccharospirillum impatiens]|uniref:EVE domain-containing protein n=1 Tax=Saccharospirillum impatiens TaxID=169438 RepID=UPI00040430A1|nr:EVE domain-containing protein [Saccharospirillum impatiens]